MSDAELVDRLRRIQVSSLCDADKTLPVCDPAIGAMLPGLTVVGPAYTVRADGGDLLGMVAALGAAPPGAVLVVATGDSPLAVSGELFAGEAQRRGLAGIVIDGRCRDRRGLRRVGLPVFARGSIPMAGKIATPPVVDVPVTCGGVDVVPGDLVFGDDDGVVFAPAHRFAAAIDRAEQIERTEAAVAAALERGVGLGELTNAAEHLADVRAGRPSTFTFHDPH